MSSIGERIKTLRINLELSQSEVAKAADITEATLSRYENDKRSPKGEIISRLANILGTTSDFLLNGKDSSTPTNNFTETDIPKEYASKYKVTSRDKKQYFESMKKNTEAFFMNDEIDEEDKKEILDTMTEIFWQAKAMNKRKPKNDK